MRIARLQDAVARRALARCSVALLAALLALAPGAGADVGEKIIERCTHGQSLGGFSQRPTARR